MTISRTMSYEAEVTCGECDDIYMTDQVLSDCPDCGARVTACNACGFFRISECVEGCHNGSHWLDENDLTERFVLTCQNCGHLQGTSEVTWQCDACGEFSASCHFCRHSETRDSEETCLSCTTGSEWSPTQEFFELMVTNVSGPSKPAKPEKKTFKPNRIECRYDEHGNMLSELPARSGVLIVPRTIGEWRVGRWEPEHRLWRLNGTSTLEGYTYAPGKVSFYVTLPSPKEVRNE